MGGVGAQGLRGGGGQWSVVVVVSGGGGGGVLGLLAYSREPTEAGRSTGDRSQRDSIWVGVVSG